MIEKLSENWILCKPYCLLASKLCTQGNNTLAHEPYPNLSRLRFRYCRVYLYNPNVHDRPRFLPQNIRVDVHGSQRTRK